MMAGAKYSLNPRASFCKHFFAFLVVAELMFPAKSIAAGGGNDAAILMARGIGNFEEKKYDTSLKLFQQAAVLGSAVAMYRIGTQYELGQGVHSNIEIAKRWYEEGAKRGDTDSMVALGYLFLTGASVEKNPLLGMRWMGEAAKRGSPYAMHSIGLAYSAGDGVSRDYGVALKWYEKAAQHGYAASMHNLGIAYDFGEGVAINACTARHWYKKAIEADPKNSLSLYNLGIHEATGSCGTKNLEAARKYLKLAIKLGNTDAERKLAELDQPEQRISIESRGNTNQNSDDGSDFHEWYNRQPMYEPRPLPGPQF